MTVVASSGCCSHHGGVDCAAGQDTDGSVICMDGWRDSSCSYSSMAKCKKNKETTRESASINKTTEIVEEDKNDNYLTIIATIAGGSGLIYLIRKIKK